MLVPTLAVVAVVCVLGRRQHGHRRALLLAVATGIMFGVQAALSKSVLTIGTEGGLHLAAVVTSWELYALLVMSVASVALQQLAFQASDLSASQPAITVLTPLSGAVCGVAIFGERLQTTTGRLGRRGRGRAGDGLVDDRAGPDGGRPPGRPSAGHHRHAGALNPYERAPRQAARGRRNGRRTAPTVRENPTAAGRRARRG